VILIDSNIPMCLIGAPHPHKTDAQMLLERAIAAGDRLVTDVEVFQEILHRYVAIGRREAIEPAFAVLRSVVDEIFPIEDADMLRAKDIVLGTQHFSARDALHLAVMERCGITRIMSFDAGFDRWVGLTRIHSAA